jgi:protocatechuate 3,4-dioxygenase, alpha subunit
MGTTRPWEKVMDFLRTPSQTVGPYFVIGCDRLKTTDLTAPGVTGERIEISGCVIDGDGAGVPDAMLEVWQANSAGKYAHPEDWQDQGAERGFQGFGRVATDANGAFHFRTIKPGTVPGPGGAPQAPHILVSVFMRGLLRRLVTRMYFPDEPANDQDPVLNFVEPSRRETLIATKNTPDNQLEWKVVLQGENETVFFDIGL